MWISALGSIVNHEIKLYARKGGELVTIMGFFLIALTLFPFALGADNPALATFAPALIWVVALLASLLSLPAMFYRDMQDGALDQLRLSGIALEWIVFAKCLANWIACQLPLILLSPLLGMMLGIDEEQGARMMLSLLLGTPLLCCVGALGGALAMHAANLSGVLAIIVLPLYIPTLIFATTIAMSSPTVAVFGQAEAMMLSAMLFAAIPFSCWIGAWLVRMQD